MKDLVQNFRKLGLIGNVISNIYTKSYKNSKIPFDNNDYLYIIEEVISILEKENAVLEIGSKDEKLEIVFVGDIHGSIESLLRIFDERGSPKNTKYLFLGDYVDRGRNSIEVIILLYAYKCLYPNNIYLIRGNHEFRNLTDHYGFKCECLKRMKDGEEFYNRVTNSFKFLPICAIVNDSIFCVHGGISALIDNRQELMNITKVGDHFSENDSVQAEFLWNDPDDSISAYKRSPRGLGAIFGREALDFFLKSLGFDLVIRGHQNERDGYNWPFEENEGILTVFSAIDYCGTLNDGGYAVTNVETDSNEEKQNLVDVFTLDYFAKKKRIYPPEESIENVFTMMNASLPYDNSYDLLDDIPLLVS